MQLYLKRWVSLRKSPDAGRHSAIRKRSRRGWSRISVDRGAGKARQAVIYWSDETGICQPGSIGKVTRQKDRLDLFS